MAEVLHFSSDRTERRSSRVARVHDDGSVTFQGERYRNLTEVPPEYVALRPDLECYRRWLRSYRQIQSRVAAIEARRLRPA